MQIKSKLKSIYAGKFFFAFMLTTLLTPANIINKIFFLIILLWTFYIFGSGRFPKRLLIPSSLAFISIFIYGYALSAININDHDLALQLLLTSFIPILIHFVLYYELNIDKLAELCGKLMVATTAIFWILVLNPEIPNSTDLISWYQEISQSASSERDYLGDGLVLTLALSSAPFLFIPWCLVLLRVFDKFSWNDSLWAILYLFAILLSGARGIVVVSIIFLSALIFFKSKKIITRYLLFITISLGFIFIWLYLISNTAIFSSDETSNSVKVGHFISFLDQLSWRQAIFGNGLGSYYFTSGSGIWKSHTELTPIDLVRYLGFPLSLILYLSLTFPRPSKVFFKKKENKLVFCAFVLYLILSFTNPVLFNSIGMLVVIWYWTKYLSSPNVDNNQRQSSNLLIKLNSIRRTE